MCFDRAIYTKSRWGIGCRSLTTPNPRRLNPQVEEIVQGVQLYLTQSYQATYGIVALSASWPSPPAAPAALLPIDFLFHPAVFPAFSRDQLSYTRVMEPEACELLTKALAPFVSYCDLHNVYGLANPSTFVFELRPAGADAAPKLDEEVEQVGRGRTAVRLRASPSRAVLWELGLVPCCCLAQ